MDLSGFCNYSTQSSKQRTIMHIATQLQHSPFFDTHTQYDLVEAFTTVPILDFDHIRAIESCIRNGNSSPEMFPAEEIALVHAMIGESYVLLIDLFFLAVASRLYGDERAPFHFKTGYTMIQSMLDQVSSNFIVAATSVYVAAYLIYDNEMERAMTYLSYSLDFIRNGLVSYQKQSVKHYAQGAFLIIAFFIGGLCFIDDTRNYIRMMKTLAYTARARQLEKLMVSHDKQSANISETQTEMELILNDLLNGCAEFHIDLETIENIAAQYSALLDFRKTSITSECDTEPRKMQILMFCHACRIQLMEQQGRPLSDIRRSADFLAIMCRSSWFSHSSPGVGEVLTIAMETHMRCIRENIDPMKAAQSLLDEIAALKFLSTRYPLIQARYGIFILNTEIFLSNHFQE
jgi:hypothetical protein